MPDGALLCVQCGYYLSMYDPRVTMSMIFLYGKACAEQDHERAGVLYAQLSRAVQDDEEAPARSEDRAGALLTLPVSEAPDPPPARLVRAHVER